MRSKEQTKITCDGCLKYIFAQYDYGVPTGWFQIEINSGDSSREKIDLCGECFDNSIPPSRLEGLGSVIKKYFGWGHKN